MSWREIFQEHSLVKNANASDLDTSSEGALVVSGLRIDNPAATWVSRATLKAAALRGEPINKYASDQVNRACALHGITEDMFQLKDVEGYSFIVKEAGMNAEFCILTQDSFDQAVQALFEKRASAPYSFCRECASRLADVKASAGYFLDTEDNTRLQKMAGSLDFNADAAAEAINERALYIRDYKGDFEGYQSLSKLASVCQQIPRTNNALLANEIISCIDDVDHKYGLLGKFASCEFTPIEEVAYCTYEQSLLKEAGELVNIDGTRKMARRSFMIPEVCDEMAKWASDNGYATTADPGDIIDCVNSMSEMLRDEFVQLFG